MTTTKTTTSGATVLVTGANGFLAGHCIRALLDAGYRVRGTVRSPAKARAASDRGVELVAADLTSDAGWDEAVRGCDYVLHTASPLPSAPPRDENDLIVPARDGALRVMRAASRASVKRVVFTSSVVAILAGAPRDRRFTEADWSNLAGKSVGAYEKSKTIAERAVWELHGSLPERERFELVVLNPGLILGPVLGPELNTSVLVVHKLLTHAFPACPDLHFAVVDVRDVAAAQVLALTEPRAAGERFICANEDISMRTIAKVLDEHFTPRGYRIPTGNLPGVALRVIALFDKAARLALANLGRPENVDNTKIRSVLGWTPRPLEETIVATAESLIEHGLVAPPSEADQRRGQGSRKASSASSPSTHRRTLG